MSDMLSIGASGVRAYQTALTTVGDNIANTGVEGYTRRTTTLGQVSSVGGITGRAISGSGVTVLGIRREAEAWRATSVRSAGADLARTETGSVWLNAIQSSLTGNSLGERLTGFFTTARALAADPTSVPQRAVLVETATTLAAAFAATGRALDQSMAELDATAQQATDQLNALGASLAKVNDGLARAGVGGGTAAQLADQRDQILEQMSALTDIGVTIDPVGRATVKLGGSSGSGGPTFVVGTQAGHVTFDRQGGATALVVQQGGSFQTFTPVGGALAGIGEGATRIADTRASLNAIASDFVAVVNAGQAGGRDLDGQPGAPLFAVGHTPTDLTMVLDDPRGLAAAAVGAGTRDASNLAALERERGGRGWEKGVTALVAGNAAALEQRKLVTEAQTAIRDGAIAAQAAVSGVDLDQEAVDLMRFQQAYQASSRVIQVARDVMQTILDIR
jgi:flagellar hook-associated protein 1 FlgK